jgi:hypothetical protein
MALDTFDSTVTTFDSSVLTFDSCAPGAAATLQTGGGPYRRPRLRRVPSFSPPEARPPRLVELEALDLRTAAPRLAAPALSSEIPIERRRARALASLLFAA